ncbi:hypothetical protein EON67_08135 [archaeon]|nr:MAG: hypothetical protein EON67_08135 [archaeon]
MDVFVAKISNSNSASVNLFAHKLGFVEAKRIAAFEEVHLALGPAQGLERMLLARTTALAYEERAWMVALEDEVDGAAGGDAAAAAVGHAAA